MSYCCPVDPEKKKEWEERMLREIDFPDDDIKKASEVFSALGTIRLNCLLSSLRESLHFAN